MLVRLVYASRASGDIDERLLQAILESSRKGNLENGITGILCANPKGGMFLQVLEGSRERVNRLYANLLRDPRHGDVTLLHFEEIAERRFSSWQMGSVDVEKINRSTILRFSEQAELDPFRLSGSAALALLGELAETASIGNRESGRKTGRRE